MSSKVKKKVISYYEYLVSICSSVYPVKNHSSPDTLETKIGVLNKLLT